MIYIKFYKSKNFYFLIPLNQLVTDETSYKKIESLTFSKNPIPVNKLTGRQEEHELLKLIYDQLAENNLFSLFGNILALQFITL